MKSWNMVGTVGVWNGTVWNPDIQGGGATSLDCCNLTTTSPTTATATTPQT